MNAASAAKASNPLRDVIVQGDVESLSNFFYTSAAKASGIVKLAPEGTDWNDYTFNRELLSPVEHDPARSMEEALRWCVICDDIPQCDASTSGIMYVDPETGATNIAAICGPAHDHDVAIRIIARDLRAEQADGLPRSKSAERIRRQRKTVELEFSHPKADNDNNPDRIRLDRFRRTELSPDKQGEWQDRGRDRWGLAKVEWNGLSGTIFVEDDTLHFWSPKGIIQIAERLPLPIICPTEWHGQPVPRRQWFVEDLIPMRTVTILSGDGGVGKSLLALQIAAASALSCDTLGLEPLAGRALYLGAEDDADEFHRRLADIVRHHGFEMSDLFRFRLLPMADMDALLSIPNRAGVMEPTPVWNQTALFAEEFRPGVIVLDTAADLYGGDEIKRAQVRQFIAMLRRLALKVDCAIILLAHPSVSGMASGTGSSGSTAWNNSARSRLYLTKPEGKADLDPDARLLKTMKANYGKTGDEIRLRWQEGVFVIDDGKTSPALGILNKRAEEVFTTLLSSFNRLGQNVSDVTGTNYAPAKMAKHPEAKGVPKSALADAMQRLIEAGDVKIVTEGPPSRQRKRLVLAAEDFGPE